MIKNLKYILYWAILFGGMMACGDSFKESVEPGDVPFNPYDTVNYDVELDLDSLPQDPNSFPALYETIFSPTCNQPACHDGSFEPDFRTLQGAYNTLVLHPIVKNYNPAVDGRNPLAYRVQPGASDMSMMYKRISEHFPPNFEQMPSSGIALSNEEIAKIKNWIDGGAKDIYGNAPEQANLQPYCVGLVAVYPDLFNFRADTTRGGDIRNPFALLRDQKVTIHFAFQDGLSDQSVLWGEQISSGKVKFSNQLFEFEDAIELDLEKNNDPAWYASIFSQDYTEDIPYYHSVTFKPADLNLEQGKFYFIRMYVQDAEHSMPTEIPKSDTPTVFITHFAFVLI